MLLSIRYNFFFHACSSKKKGDMSTFFAFVKLRIRRVQWHFINYFGCNTCSAPRTVLVYVLGFFSMEQHYMYHKTYVTYYTLPI